MSGQDEIPEDAPTIMVPRRDFEDIIDRVSRLYAACLRELNLADKTWHELTAAERPPPAENVVRLDDRQGSARRHI